MVIDYVVVIYTNLFNGRWFIYSPSFRHHRLNNVRRICIKVQLKKKKKQLGSYSSILLRDWLWVFAFPVSSVAK